MSKAEPERLADVDPVLADYAAALHERDTPAPDRVDATWAAVKAQTRSRTRLWVPLAITAAAVLVGIVVSAPSVAFERDEPTRPQETPYQGDGPATDGIAAPLTPDLNPTAMPAPGLVAVPDPVPEPPSAPKLQAPRHAQPPPPTPAPSSLAQETALLREIQTAQAAGQHAHVLELTREHADRFPKGTFLGERTLARVRALCRLGRTADARQTSERFVRQQPGSHLLPQFETACVE